MKTRRRFQQSKDALIVRRKTIILLDKCDSLSRRDAYAEIRVVGSRSDEDHGEYPDIDMVVRSVPAHTLKVFAQQSGHFRARQVVFDDPHKNSMAKAGIINNVRTGAQIFLQ